MVKITDIHNALIAIDSHRLQTLIQSAIEGGIPAREILKQGLIAAMDVVGERMENGEMFIPEVLMCAKAMESGINILKPYLTAEETESKGRIVIGTVKGDLHDIGKNLVAMMLKGGGYEVINLGVDVTPETFADAVRTHNPHVLALSALLTTTMPMMRETIAAVENSGLRDRVAIIVGGAPVNRAFAEQIGADGYAADAGGALKLLKQHMKQIAA
ncbi:MtbC: dimethylamine corrinoid protein [Desulfosarcina variabilis str. Montpellier]|uniref:cobalamin B12-binding domain-containing protein n=1 Tax=Desulfosarcina variabilis TaxID=2300 RepID=UPI003AFB115C